jgi:RNA polymerase sigma-70 factor (ECF subfamily)
MSSSIPISIEGAQDGAAVVQSTPLTERISDTAFYNLYRESGPKLLAYIRRAAGDVALAEDILHEAFLRFLRICPAGLEERQHRAYLYRTATTLLVDHWRRARRERLWGLKTLLQEKAPDNRAMGGDISRIFAKLKPQEQALLWLAYVEGFDHREIAEALELGEKSVRVLLFRARKKMAGDLIGAGLGPPGR